MDELDAWDPALRDRRREDELFEKKGPSLKDYDASATPQEILEVYKTKVAEGFKKAEKQTRERANTYARRKAKASKTANPTLRRFPQIDKQYVQIIGDAERGGYLEDVPLVRSKISQKIIPKNTRYRLPTWEKTTLPLKALSMSIESTKGKAWSINLRPSPKTYGAALRSSRGPASYMQDRIRGELQKRFGEASSPDFWLVIETDSDEQFHVHGSVEVPQVPDATRMIDDALRAAGGVWSGAGGGIFQQKGRYVTEPIYWASYTLKHMNISGSRIDRKLIASTEGMQRRAKAGWEHLRATMPQSPP